MESNALHYFCVTFALLFKYEQGLIVFFLIQEVLFIANIKAFHTKKSVMNKPQAEGRVNHVCTEEVQHSSAIKKNNEAQLLVYLK